MVVRIFANAIAPGTIETPLVDNLAGTSEDEAGKRSAIIKMGHSIRSIR